MTSPFQVISVFFLLTSGKLKLQKKSFPKKSTLKVGSKGSHDALWTSSQSSDVPGLFYGSRSVRVPLPRFKAVMTSLGVAILAAATLYLTGTPTVALWAGVIGGLLCFLSVEVYYSVQFRRELECPVCRFDPLLYRRAPEKAKEQCLEGLKRKEQVLAAKGQSTRPEIERARELHG